MANRARTDRRKEPRPMNVDRRKTDVDLIEHVAGGVRAERTRPTRGDRARRSQKVRVRWSVRRGRAPATAERIVLRELRAVAYPTRGLMLVRAGVALGIVRRESDVHRRAHARRQPTPAASEPLRSTIEDA